jgi:CRISPR/Cas system-associated protein Csx1
MLGRALYVTEGLPKQVITLNSDPVTSQPRCGDVRINVRINVVDVMDMDKEGVTISDVLKSIGKFKGAILNIQPQTGVTINEELKALRKNEKRLSELSRIYVELIGKALDYGMILYIATRFTHKDFGNFKSLVHDKMAKVDDVIKRYVSVKYVDNVIVTRTYVVNSDLVLQYIATKILEHINDHINDETKGCRFKDGKDGYDLECLSRLIDSLKVGGFARTIFKNEVDIITKNYSLTDKPKLLCEVMGHSDCKECSANKRNLIAHAGLEENVTYVYKQGDRVLAKCEKCLEEIKRNLS